MLPTVMAMAKVLSNNEMKKCQISPFRSSSRSGGINPGALFPDTFVTPDDGIGSGVRRGVGRLAKSIKASTYALVGSNNYSTKVTR